MIHGLDAWLWRRGIDHPAIRVLLRNEILLAVFCLLAGGLAFTATPWFLWFGVGLTIMALIGVGNLGKAILNHGEFRSRGFNIVGIFDCDPFKIGEIVHGLEVHCTRDLKDMVTDLNIEIGIITTPPERAQRAAQHLMDAGITSILNFAPARIKVPDRINVEYVDFFHHLYSLAFNHPQTR